MASVAHIASFTERGNGFDRAQLFSIILARSFKKGEFTLSSGVKSNLYFNMKPTMMTPRGAELSALAFLRIAADLRSDYVSGLEMGAVPVIGAMAALSSVRGEPLKTTFVRKQPKAHGTRVLIEGLGPDETLNDKKILIIDDVATSGKSFMIAAERVREAGGIVEHAACIVNRDEGADALLSENGIKLHAIFHGSEFLAAS